MCGERERERERQGKAASCINSNLSRSCFSASGPTVIHLFFPLRATPFILGRVRENLDARPTEIPPRNAADYFAGDICQNT